MMNAYRVKFFKRLLSSYGMPFNVCQRTIDIQRSRSLDRAVEAAKLRFERCECVGKWTLHADYFEVEILSQTASAVFRQEEKGVNWLPTLPRSEAARSRSRSHRHREKKQVA